ncbi:conserved exported hypothetical protein [uncultured Desulfobacterium sp.]|uniref:Thioredoxin domain-containing protein n=1 Tax=uncultured Desulfobacterium sp. TaxID=201089 RepID=A0A445N3L1_9BACT|nr:conserved exported hypothetical protein [uncultured Desulfobacterium sp.]
MRLRHLVSLLILLIFPILPSQGHAKVEWSIYRTLNLDAQPLDVAVSVNGRWIFVLTEQSDILIFLDGNLEDRIKVGNHIDQIEVGPREELLLLKSRQNKTIQVLALEFIKDINIIESPFKGPVDAPVVIAIFSDFQCEYCKALLPLLDQVADLYPDKIKIVFKNFPLKMHKLASKAAIAALAANSYDLFWQYHDRLFDSQGQLSDQKFLDIAAQLGINQKDFEREMGNPQILSIIQKDLQDGQKAGVRSVPSVFINGRMLKERSLKGFQTVIDKELNKKESAH